MKTYKVYIDGKSQGFIQARSSLQAIKGMLFRIMDIYYLDFDMSRCSAEVVQ